MGNTAVRSHFSRKTSKSTALGVRSTYTFFVNCKNISIFSSLLVPTQTAKGRVEILKVLRSKQLDGTASTLCCGYVDECTKSPH